MFAKNLALTGLASVASAHILMTNPVPFGASSLSNGPLDASGSDFPCKMRSGVYDAEGASNVYAQGSTQKLAFRGTAVHGGGSCQVSITTDLEPTKNSVWKVIKSIEGGCPAKDAAGNIGDDANLDVPFQYDFDVPQDLPAGDYAMAWTWFNKIGNREMYMNCAPMTVTGSGGSDSFVDSLPDLFVANIGNGCSTTEGNDVQFPNPGDIVEKLNGATDVFAPPSGSCPTGVSKPQPEEPEQPEPTAAPSPTTLPGNVFITVPSSAGAEPTAAPPAEGGPTFITEPSQPEPTSVSPPEVTEPATPVEPTEPATPVEPTEPATSAEPSAPATPPTEGTPSGSHAAGSACSSEGNWNCIGGSSFQRCASGVWSGVMQLAAGSACVEGEAENITFSKRAIRGSRSLMG